ncbi:MAG: hypothetical protein AVDCRST_MAG41-3891, partial [uncultured Corynebacteriales bacterium]
AGDEPGREPHPVPAGDGRRGRRRGRAARGTGDRGRRGPGRPVRRQPGHRDLHGVRLGQRQRRRPRRRPRGAPGRRRRRWRPGRGAVAVRLREGHPPGGAPGAAGGVLPERQRPRGPGRRGQQARPLRLPDRRRHRAGPGGRLGPAGHVVHQPLRFRRRGHRHPRVPRLLLRQPASPGARRRPGAAGRRPGRPGVPAPGRAGGHDAAHADRPGRTAGDRGPAGHLGVGRPGRRRDPHGHRVGADHAGHGDRHQRRLALRLHRRPAGGLRGRRPPGRRRLRADLPAVLRRRPRPAVRDRRLDRLGGGGQRRGHPPAARRDDGRPAGADHRARGPDRQRRL